MQCLRTLGVLIVTLSLVWSMTLETTSSRYLEDRHSFKSGLGDKNLNLSINYSSLNINNSTVNSLNHVNDSLQITVIRRYANNSDTSLVLNATDISDSSRQDGSKELVFNEGRKIKSNNKRPIKKNNGTITNFIRTTIKEMKQNITSSKNNGKIKHSSSSTATKQPLKSKLSTMAPITIKLTKPTIKRPNISTSKSNAIKPTKRTTKRPNVSTPKSYKTSTRKPPIKIKVTPSSTRKRPKPTIKRILTKWKDNIANTSDLKQNWYEDGVPYPNPMPDISSSSPPFSISDSGSQTYGSSTVENIYLDEIVPQVEQEPANLSPEIYTNSPSDPLQGVPPILPLSDEEDLESISVPAQPVSGNENPISTFNLDMLPSDLTRDPSGLDCPTVHISSSVLSPLQRQGCSDLNLVLNTHYHQNQDTRNPVPAISTYDASAPGAEDAVEAVEDPIIEDGVANAGPTGAADSVATYTGGGSPAGGSSGGPGGSGGSGGSGGDGGGLGSFKLPDLKPVFRAVGYLMRGLWWLLQKLMNPWLYIVPIVLFFAIGFLGILTLFPWWIPFVFLYFSVKTEEPKNTVSHVKHHHKPVIVKHEDGWYWDQHTKSWQDVTAHHGYRHRRSDEEAEDLIDDKIIRLGDKYFRINNKTRRKFKKRSLSPSINRTNENVSQESNASTIGLWDVRSPPKVQNQIKEKLSSKYSVESSHAGIAIPIDEDIELLEESTKKMNFYKLERPTTTNGGLSTWILLSGQASPTTPKPTTKKTSVKPIIMKDEKNNETLMLSDKPLKMVKPAFKLRSTTARPVTVSNNITKTTTVRVNTFSPSTKATTRKPTKLTKIKASLLQSMSNNKTTTTTPISKIKSTTVTNIPSIPTTTTKVPKDSNSTDASNDVASTDLPVEAKEGEQELPPTNEKKKKTQKRKKNKNKRRKPDKNSKEGDNKLKEVESPGTQLYSYLRSEIIPVTVGVSLVGLLVTAGLASYYLQPFAALRRSDPIERKDVEGSYYYQNEYSNAMPEEEAIGKVIAGMPENTLQGIKQPTSRNTYPQNVRYRHVDRRSQIYMNPYGLVEDVKLTDRGVAEGNNNKFVVGSIPKETVQEVTPAIVPEHGPRNLPDEKQKFVVGNIPKEFISAGASPRNLRIRKRREIVPNDIENEIDSGEYPITSTTPIDTTLTPETEETLSDATTQEVTKGTTPTNIFNPNERPNTIFELLAELFKLKVQLGLELLQNVTNSVSTYVSRVHTKLDEHYKRTTRRNNNNYSKNSS